MHIRNSWYRAFLIGDKFVQCHRYMTKISEGRVIPTSTLTTRRSYTTPAYHSATAKQPLVYRNVGQQLLRAVELYGDRPAVISCHEGATLTYSELSVQAERLALALESMGLKRGDHLAVWLPNGVQWCVTALAASLGGFPLVCVSPLLEAVELQYALAKADVRALVTAEASDRLPLKEIPNEAEQREKLQLKAVIMKPSSGTLAEHEGYHDYDQLLAESRRSQDVARLRYKVHEIEPESPFCIMFTAGTTGQPKAVQLSHFIWVNMGYYMGRFLDVHTTYRRVCLHTPLCHAHGMGVLMSSLYFGATMVMPNDRFEAEKSLQAIEEHQCNVVTGMPAMYLDMIAAQKRNKRNLKSLELGVVGGAFSSAEMVYNAKNTLRLKEFRISYGLTETTGITFHQDGQEDMVLAASNVGRLLDHGEAKVIDSQGRTVRNGEPGELCVRGFFNMIGYYGDEERTREIMLPGGWIRTGDLARMDALAGTVSIIGRQKEMITRDGENIMPKEIEAFLESHDEVLEAQVIGVADERLGEVACAFVRLNSAKNSSLTEASLRQCTMGEMA